MVQSISRNDDKLPVQSRNIAVIVMCGWDDHRIVMALTVAGMVAGDTEIDTAESVAVSYPGFFEEMKRLGMRVKKV
jgi:3-phosphoshikimate 1-carboxyvinyltransferase